MRKISWLLAAVGGAALVSAIAVQSVAASPKPDPEHGPATVLKFSTMAPVTGPFVGAANPVRGVVGGGLPWVLKAASGSLKRDGHLVLRVRGLVLAKQAPVPTALQGTNPFADFRALVSCQTIGAGNTATVVNVSTGDFKANSAGDSLIHARVALPRPCVAPIVFVTGPTGTDAWFAVTGS
ncbi:MAG TPA: hypothetical protein VN695_14330 [Streptosporangiaceae bacterium]|nr:hypothetical protein [Streptosporangiaceae bacterium]